MTHRQTWIQKIRAKNNQRNADRKQKIKIKIETAERRNVRVRISSFRHEPIDLPTATCTVYVLPTAKPKSTFSTLRSHDVRMCDSAHRKSYRIPTNETKIAFRHWNQAWSFWQKLVCFCHIFRTLTTVTFHRLFGPEFFKRRKMKCEKIWWKSIAKNASIDVS